MNRKEKILLYLLIILFLFLRLYRLSERLNFAGDQGLFFLRSWEIFKNKELTLLGPSTSLNYQSRYFFQGPAIYYSILLILLLSAWNPLNASIIFIFLNLFVSLWFFKVLKKFFNKTVALIFLLLISTSPLFTYFSQFIWNPNFLLLITPIILGLILSLRKRRSLARFFLIGGLLGFGLQFHYQYILAIIFTLIFIWRQYRVKFKECLFLGWGLVIGYLPLIVFELRNDFYNLRTIGLILAHQAGGLGNKLVPHYWLVVLWLITFLLAVVLARLFKKNRPFFFNIIGLTILFSFLLMPQWLEENYQPFKNWHYKDELRSAEIIIEQDLENYNIANLLYGDTRAQAIRYLTTVAGAAPLGVEAYKDNQFLFVITSDRLETIKTYSIWEVDSIEPAQLLEQWIINDKVKLFLLKRI